MHSEIKDINRLNFYFENYEEQEKIKQKQAIYENYALAYQIATFVGCIISGKQIPTINELYPDLEDKNKIAYLKFKEVADLHNSRKGVINN